MEWASIFKFEIVNNKYKITYWGDKPIEVYISTKLIGLHSVHKTIRYKFETKGSWFIPILDYRGCSTIQIKKIGTDKILFEKLIDKSLSFLPNSQNVICVGLNKTGTSSFTSGLQNLGYNMFPETDLFHFVVPDVYHGDFGSIQSALNNPQYNLYNDVPFSLPKMYENLYQMRPDDIYVLTVRSTVDKWVQSVINFYQSITVYQFNDDNSYINSIFSDESGLHFIGYLKPLFESWNIKNSKNLEQTLAEVYIKHNNDCIEFFKDKPNFRVVEIEKKGELKRFTNWLNIPNNVEDFPWENKTK